MNINKKISEFISVDGFDNTTQIPIVQGSPMFNGKITPEKFIQTIADDMLIELNLDNVDNTSDINKPISTATKTYVDNKVKTDVPVGAKFTDTIVDISGKADKTYVDEQTDIINEQIDIINEQIDIINDKHIPIITLTEDEYHFLNTKDPNTFYFIKEE